MTEKRIALIIATYQYEDTDLRQLVSPTHDAEALSQVLKDPVIGGFDEVQTLLNKPSQKIKQVIESFFIEGKREDLLLLYFSCHGIKDTDGHLYFATTDTKRKLLLSTGIEANFVNTNMRRCRSRKQVLLLDCCYSGAFARGMLAKADKKIGTGEQFDVRGRVVLTASDAMQYSFEGDKREGKPEPSVFTSVLLHGLKTGEADKDRNGRITFDELCEYVHDHVIDITPDQVPEKWYFGNQGQIVIAQNPNPVVKPVELSSDLQQSVNDRSRPLWEREGAVRELGRLLQGKDKGLALSAHEALKRMKDDDSRLISTEAARILDEYNKTLSQKKLEPEPEQLITEKKEKETARFKQGQKPAVAKTKLRSQPIEDLTEDEVKIMLKDKGFFDSTRNKTAKGFSNNYELQHDGKVVFDKASGLMWQQSGSDKEMAYKKAKSYIMALNRQSFTGYNDWRLPTLEEAMSLMEPKERGDGLYIDTVFDKEQQWIWTSDLYGPSSAWVVYFRYGNCYYYFFSSSYVRAVR